MHHPMPALTADSPCWDIFCRVIDNFGDIGVCWRLATQLATRGVQVRLWVDDASALRWMAPGTLIDAARPAQDDAASLLGAAPGIEVRAWPQAAAMPDWANLPRAQVWIEAFGCDLPPAFIAAQRTADTEAAPQWLNLEYLSAEAYVERCHRLPSPVMHGPGAGLTRHFFYPGFTPRTGGLLREADLLARQAAFDAPAWLAQHGIPDVAGERRISLFCYEPPALAAWLAQLAAAPQPTRLLVTAGRATQAVQATLNSTANTAHGALHIHYLPTLTQTDYDHLLWACELNLVRGEDSLVRALWAGRPLVWHIYPQDDGAHLDKLEAFLNQLQTPATLRQFHRVWNANATAQEGDGTRAPPALELPEWRAWATDARAALLAQADLAQQLLEFVAKKR